jgi:hypothetical protein
VTEEVYQRVDLLDETVFRLLTTLACDHSPACHPSVRRGP